MTMSDIAPLPTFGALIIGDEILSGRRVDKHLPKLIELLGDRGLTLSYAIHVGDDPTRITHHLRQAFDSGDWVFSFGGIGATPDDHTRQCAASALGQPLVLHPEAKALITERMRDMATQQGTALDLTHPDSLRRLEAGAGVLRLQSLRGPDLARLEVEHPAFEMAVQRLCPQLDESRRYGARTVVRIVGLSLAAAASLVATVVFLVPVAADLLAPLVPATVERIEYDPNRTAFIALLKYADGELSYIIAPNRLSVGDQVVAGERVDTKVGNAMLLGQMPVGTICHNVEMKPGKGGQIARSAGTYVQVVGRDRGMVIVRLNSGEQRYILGTCMATVGAVSNPDNQNQNFGKAGRSRWMGRRPLTRGVAKNPVDHPHGGGEGRTSGGRHPVTPWGKKTRGPKTRKNKSTSKFIVTSRHVRKKK